MVVGLRLAVFQRDLSVGIVSPAVSLRERQFTRKTGAHGGGSAAAERFGAVLGA